MHGVIFICTALRKSKAPDAWISSTTRRAAVTEINKCPNGGKRVTSAELKRQHLKCFVLRSVTEIHFYAFGLLGSQSLVLQKHEESNYNINVFGQKSETKENGAGCISKALYS